ncbi:MAG: mechanosensitive ion channel [Cyanophyceae cyanobacterium]
MIEISSSITVPGVAPGATSSLLLAQAVPDFLTNAIGGEAATLVFNIVKAVAVLIIGWIVATFVALAVNGLLKKVSIDNRLAGWVAGKPGDAPDLPVEKWISSAAFWGIMLFTILVFLDTLGLQSASAPLQNFLGEITTFAPRLLSAAVLAAVAWVLATLSRLLVTQGLKRFAFDDMLAEQFQDFEGGSPVVLNETIGNFLYWFILLLFLPFILDTLNLQGPLEPIQNLVDQVLSTLPQIFKAGVIGVIGWFIARLIRSIASNFLAASGIDRLGSRIGLSQESGTQSISWLAGTLAYAIVLVVTAISVLKELRIEAISSPAIAMLEDVLGALPYVLKSAAVLIAAYIVGRFIAGLVTNILTGMGFNNILRVLGFPSDTTTYGSRTPSEIAGIVVLVGILLFAAVPAVDGLQVPVLTTLVAELPEVFFQVMTGVIIFAVGLYLANLTFRIIATAGSRQSMILAQAARIAIIAFVAAMALQQIGIATDIVNLAFGLLLGAIAVAIAIAFGLGGRDVAAEEIRSLLHDFKDKE